MYLPKLIALLLLLLSGKSHAQYYKRAQLDSLKRILKEQQGEEEVKTQLNLAEAYYFFQLDTSLLYLNSGRSQSVKIGYEYGICRSYLIESNIQFRKGNSTVEEMKFIKTQCANWFEQNGFVKDALIAKISRNNDILYSEGRPKAFKNAEAILAQAKKLKDPQVLGLAWSRITKTKPAFYETDAYPGSMDSMMFYMNQSGDSLGIINHFSNHLFRKSAGTVPKSEIVKLEQIADRWEVPLFWMTIERIKVYPFAAGGHVDSTIDYVSRIEKLEQQYGGRDIYGESVSLVSIAFQQANEFRKTIDRLLEDISENEKYGVISKKAANLFELAQCHFVLKEYEPAITYFLETLRLSEKLENYFLENSTKRRLADLYVLTGENDKAETLYLETIEWASQKTNISYVQIMLGNAYNSLAILYEQQERYDEATVQFQRSCDQLSYNSRRLMEPKVGLLSMYLNQGKVDQADSLYQEILLPPLEQHRSNSEDFLFEEGRLQMALGNDAKGITSFQSFLAIGTGEEKKKEAHYFLYEAYKEKGQHESALRALEMYNAIEDSLAAGKMVENVQKIQSDYEISLKELEIERLEQAGEISDLKLTQQANKLSLRKLYISLLVFAFLLLVVMGYLLFRRMQIKKEAEKKEIRKSLEIEQLKSQQKIELAEVKNNLYANISHEIKTPLTLIRVPLLNFRAKASNEDKKVYDSIVRNTDHLLEMLEELLDVSQLKSGSVKLQPSTFNLASLLSQIKLNFSPLFLQKGIQLDLEVQLGQNHFYGDENKLKIVINNLLKNAFSNAHPDGWVKCEVKLGEKLTISVTNKGDQVDAKDLPYIFDKYYRSSDADYTGSGIGLAWSKEIVSLHEGVISVDNSQKDHVTFHVSIPSVPVSESRLPDAEELTVGESIAHEDEVLSSEDLPHILVVEDNHEVQEVLRTILKSEFKLDFAENGNIGEEMAIRLQPDLVLSDVMMPEKDGFGLLTALKTNFNSSHIPVVLLTAREDSVSRITGLNQDADDYIGKPFDPEELKARIHNLLRQRRRLHKLFSENPLLYSQQVKCTPIDADFLNHAQEILEKHFSNGDFSVAEFCTELASNRTSINNKLKALTNQTTAEYIKNYRLKKAERMLIETNAIIAEIYVACGFNTSQAFNSGFRKKFNCSPKEYRNTFHQK